MTKVICTTTINPPTEALIAFANMEGWTLVVAGDKKTPHQAHEELSDKTGCIYLSPDAQHHYDSELSEAIGFNCIQRRNFAFLYAHETLQADIIASVDDDNIPMQNWGKNLVLGNETSVAFGLTDSAAFDPIGATNYPVLWHRGFPLKMLRERKYTWEFGNLTADIQADLWNGEPDVDAVCRMEHAVTCEFSSFYFPMASNKPSPFNSQNTFLTRNALKHFGMICHVGRMDDIWASYHAQAQGLRVVYGAPSVVQKRNEHDLIEDMKKEYLGYELNHLIVEQIPKTKDAVRQFLKPESLKAMALYERHFE